MIIEELIYEFVEPRRGDTAIANLSPLRGLILLSFGPFIIISCLRHFI